MGGCLDPEGEVLLYTSAPRNTCAQSIPTCSPHIIQHILWPTVPVRDDPAPCCVCFWLRTTRRRGVAVQSTRHSSNGPSGSASRRTKDVRRPSPCSEPHIAGRTPPAALNSPSQSNSYRRLRLTLSACGGRWGQGRTEGPGGGGRGGRGREATSGELGQSSGSVRSDGDVRKF